MAVSGGLSQVDPVVIDLNAGAVLSGGKPVVLPRRPRSRWFLLHVYLAWSRLRCGEQVIPISTNAIRRLAGWRGTPQAASIGKQVNRHAQELKRQEMPLISFRPGDSKKAFYYTPDPERITILPNLMSAVDLLAQSGAFTPDDASDVADGLHYLTLAIFDLEDGHWEPFGQNLAQYVEQSKGREEVCVVASIHRARMLSRRNDHAGTQQELAKARAETTRLKHPVLQAYAMLVSAFSHVTTAQKTDGNLTTAKSLIYDACALLPEDAPLLIQGHLQNVLGRVARAERRLTEARLHYMQALRCWAECCWGYGLQAVSYNLGSVAYTQANNEEGAERDSYLGTAYTWFMRCREWVKRSGTGNDSNHCELALAGVCRRLGRLPEARKWALEATTIASRTNNKAQLDEATRVRFEIDRIIQQDQGHS